VPRGCTGAMRTLSDGAIQRRPRVAQATR
jgi:hypothetical protein